jgi:hypothetical protein
MCPPEELDNSQDLAVQENGGAKPAVAKDAVAVIMRSQSFNSE